MLTSIQLRHLRAYTCPSCKLPLHRVHSYPVNPAALLSRLTDTVPMHGGCARFAAPLLMEDPANRVAIIYKVKSSSSTAPSGSLFELVAGSGDMHIRLHSPEEILFLVPGEEGTATRKATYQEIQAVMLPAIRAAHEAAETQEEIDEIVRQIAVLHRFLPKPPKQ